MSLPDGATLAEVATATFHVRATSWPPVLAKPPSDWVGPWGNFLVEYPLRWHDLGEAFSALEQFWRPLLNGRAAKSDARWSPEQ